MWNNKSPSADNVTTDDIASYFVDSNGICRVCGQHHSFKPMFQDVVTSIDVISEVFVEKLHHKIVMCQQRESRI